MIRIMTDMYEGGEGGELSDMLRVVNGAGLVWRMTDLWATCRPDAPFMMLEVEEEARASPHGVEFTWEGLHDFAGWLTDCIDCELKAFRRGVPLGGAPEVMMTGYDSGDWLFEATDESYLNIDRIPPIVGRLSRLRIDRFS